MNGLRRHPLRVTGRFFWFLWVVAAALADYLIRCAFRGKASRLCRQALWLQRHSRRALRIFRLRPVTGGPAPGRGLLVSNHLSYLDVLVISAVTPAVFVAKRDVKFWPVVGLLAQLAGTVFVDRRRRAAVGRVNDQIGDSLEQGGLVVLFPEGTSSNGETVLPFKTSLLEPAAQSRHPLSVCSIQYALDDGDDGAEVSYWGDHTFFTHLLNLLGKRAVHAVVRFSPVQPAGLDRKELARQLRSEILALRTGAGMNP